MRQLETFRAEKDRFFREHPQSPLTSKQRALFRSLRYFPENPALRLVLPVEPPADSSPLVMQTSTGENRSYQRCGWLRFSVEGEEVVLTLFSDEAGGLFLPFADSLAGSETYGAGRYLEPQPLDNGRVLVDFNLAYNPYCAYNDAWSCPLTPFENRLRVAIRAGECRFGNTEA